MAAPSSDLMALRRRKAQHLKRVLENMNDLVRVEQGFRASAPHFASGMDEGRVFGGHLLAHFYMAMRQLRPAEVVGRVDVHFLNAASTQRPIHYRLLEAGGECVRMDAVQDGNVVDRAVGKYHTHTPRLGRRLRLESPNELRDLPKPSACRLLEEVLPTEPADLARPGYDFLFRRQQRDMFEVRFAASAHVRPGPFRGPIRHFMRLRKELRDVPVEEPMAVPLMISDYFSCLPVTVLMDKLQIPVELVVSLNHKVLMHTDRCDPTGWFVLELDFEKCTSTGLVLGRVAAEDGAPILNFQQQFLLKTQPKL